jgi:radical SAM superfamily enzyme YgiQ (UPF0313 family)
MRVLLVSTYELGHQPLHVASPAAALLKAGHEVRCADLSLDPLDAQSVSWADAVAFSVPMHTAMRIAVPALRQVRSSREDVPICVYGLYAHLTGTSVASGCVDVAISGEYEGRLVGWADDLCAGGSPVQPTKREVDRPSGSVELGRQRFRLPARHLLPPLDRYARLSHHGEEVPAGYVEATHGCAHRCRHCPVPVVYDGRIRLVEIDTVLADVEQLVALGARHITFGDPDFLNGPRHAMRVVDALDSTFEGLTFDVTAKIEHVLAHRDLWPRFARAGCVFVVSAFESTSPTVLFHLDKGHTRGDEVEAVSVLRSSGIEPRPSFVPFTPWTRAEDIYEMLDLVASCDLVGNVDPVQYSIRLLVPPGSLLLATAALDGKLGDFDPEHLSWTWSSEDARLDRLSQSLVALAQEAGADGRGVEETYAAVRGAVAATLGRGGSWPRPEAHGALRSAYGAEERPKLTEPWFCCAEPTGAQLEAATLTTAGACAP